MFWSKLECVIATIGHAETASLGLGRKVIELDWKSAVARNSRRRGLAQWPSMEPCRIQRPP